MNNSGVNKSVAGGINSMEASVVSLTELSLTHSSPVTQPTSRYDCSSADWERYLVEGWDSVLWTDKAWKSNLQRAGYGQVSVPKPQMGDLDNEIHPIFAWVNWVQDMDEGLWDIISPALRLASKLLLSKAALAFFRKVQFGVERQAGGRTYLHYDEPADVSAQDEEVISSLAALGSKLLLIFAVMPSDNPTTQNHARHLVSQHHFGRDCFIRGNLESLPDDDGSFHYLLINQAYADYFTEYARKQQSPKRTAPFSPTDFLRATYTLAGSLVHEIGHAFYARDRIDGNEDYIEPYFDLAQHNLTPELGYALEYAIFGVFINASIHPRLGAATEWQPVVKELVDDRVEYVDDNHLMYPMQPTWLHSLLKQTFWEQIESQPVELQVQGLFVPTDVTYGATLNPRDRLWRWRRQANHLTKYGRNLNEAALQEKVRQRRQGLKRKGYASADDAIDGEYATKSKKRRTESSVSVAGDDVSP